ncbi:MAG: primosomal protein N' [Candidatus Rokubacteria bacterium]|nr:primosomal protein N' [Candidatus Rokubacteria bacterium]
MIAEVAFDAPVGPFDYRVPDGWRLAPGQRVRAPLGPDSRVGIVLALREGPGDGLKPLSEVVDPSAVIDTAALGLVRWISSRSLSSVGSTAAGLLPPPRSTDDDAPPSPGDRPGTSGLPADVVDDDTTAGSDPVTARGPAGMGAVEIRPRERADTAATRSVAPTRHRERSLPELFTGAGREQRLLDEIARSVAGALVIVPDVEAAGRWAQRLARIDHVVRIDSGMNESERAHAWSALAARRARLAVGTRSALLAPLADGAILALVDEHETAHLPPGHPRMHARDIVLERARREHLRLILTAGTPSVEMWWRATSRLAMRVAGEPAPWPVVTLADTRGILRREALTPELSRALRETLTAGGRAFLAVSRFASALACEECGLVARCARCGLALGYSRAAVRLTCRLCRATEPPPDACPECRGRRLSPFGWGADRVEQAVTRRFPGARVARYEPDVRGARAETQRAAAAQADVVIGTRGALRVFSRASLGLAGFVSPDHLLRVPDFRASERMLAFLWAAAERVRAGGRVIVQSHNPTHHAFVAVAEQAIERFYEPELQFRAELGYPPFRHLAVVTVRPKREGDAGFVDALGETLRADTRLTVYPPAPVGRERAQRLVVKGGHELPDVLSAAVSAVVRESGRRSRGIMDVEVDPVEWRF